MSATLKFSILRISIHALRGEGDSTFLNIDMMVIEIYIHALRGEGVRALERLRVSLLISIHALRGEGDVPSGTTIFIRSNFNPRPPRGGRPFAAVTAYY